MSINDLDYIQIMSVNGLFGAALGCSRGREVKVRKLPELEALLIFLDSCVDSSAMPRSAPACRAPGLLGNDVSDSGFPSNPRCH